MVTATQSAHTRELSACWGKPANHRLAGVLDTEKQSSTACQFERALREKVVGQDQGVQALVDLYQMFCAGLQSPSRPIGNLLFLGPTGSGKTRIVEAAAEILFGDSRAMIKVDCAEFQHSHEIAKLIGSPPGYLGHRETHPLITQEALAASHRDHLKLSFLLFDEIEKASDALWQLLLGMLDKATLNAGRQPASGLVANNDFSDLEPRQRTDRGSDARRNGIRAAERQADNWIARKGGEDGGRGGQAQVLT